MRHRREGGIPTILVVVIVIAIFGVVVFVNAQPTEPLQAIIPTQASPTQVAASWQDVLRNGNFSGTVVPTVAIPDGDFAPPTLRPDTQPSQPAVGASTLEGGQNRDNAFVTGATPTLPPPTEDVQFRGASSADNNTTGNTTNGSDEAVITRIPPTDRPIPTNPPSLIPPIAFHPYDHYWFYRPIDSNRTNRGLNYYAYGTNGPIDDPYPIHHGIDMPNPVGTTVRAAGSGRVVWVTDPLNEARRVFQNSASYGNIIVIEHDFGYRGRPVYTLYAHLEEALVNEGDLVTAGEAIALLGNTGRSTGPHVQFEVRLGEVGETAVAGYGDTYNPVLWMVPYVGHGTIAGRVVDSRGEFLQDVSVQLSQNGYIVGLPTTTYVFKEVGSRVNPDPLWDENFTFADVPAGRYSVSVQLNGQRITETVVVEEGRTAFVELAPQTPIIGDATPTPSGEG